LLVLCSAPMALGVNRANVDLLIFALLTLCVPCLQHSHRFWRIVGPGVLLALTMGLKFYPLFAGIILLAVRPRSDRLVAGALGLVLLLLTAWSVVPDLAYYSTDRLPEGLHTFGAPTVFLNAGLPKSIAPLGALVFLALMGYWMARQTSLKVWTPPRELRTEYLYFILGAAILTGSFVVTVNYAYRWIFCLWMLPFLGRLQTNETGKCLRRLKHLISGLLVFVLWSDALVALSLNSQQLSQAVVDRWVTLAVICTQPILWTLFACLSGVLIHFIFSELRADKPIS
jgi:Glycosyltransferase family 87